MDFPNDVPTNVYKIDDVREIYWALYSRRHGEDEEGMKVYDDQSGEEENDVKHSVRLVEYSLREQGYHVLLDEDKPAFWIFCHSKAEMEAFAQLQDLEDFECLKSGCAHSSDLSSTSGPLTNATNPATASSRPIGGIGEINTQTFNANMKMDPWSSVSGLEDSNQSLATVGRGFTMSEICPKILAAISHTLSYFLSRAKGLLLVGSCTYVDLCTLGDHTYEHLETSLATAGTTVVSCSVRWLSSGILLFAMSEDTVPRLSTIPHVRLSSQDSSAPPIGGSLLLSPSGTVGQYHGIEDTPKSHPLYRTRAQVKSSISSDLVARGIPMPARSQWAMVLVEADKNEGENEGGTAPKSPRMTLWPAHLCLCRDAQIVAGNLETPALPGSSLESANDPLERAQEWFLGKPARMEALEARRRKDQAEAQRMREAADMEEADAVSDFEPQIDLNVTPRDVSGIYPTPPDGLPSTAHNASMSNEPHSNEHDDETNGVIASDRMHQPYEEQRSDDLFEEMDIDLFATNGLTEDDFSFFDEPSLKGEDGHEDAGVTFPTEPFTFEDPVIAPMSISPVDEHSSPASENALADSAQSLSPCLGNVTEKSEGFSVETLKTENPAADTVLLDTKHDNIHEPTTIKEEVANHLALDFELLLPKSPHPLEISFNLVPFKSDSFNFDNKYASQGRYAFRSHDLPEALKPGAKALHENHVPYLGVLEMGESSVEDDINIGKAMLPFRAGQGMNNIGRVDDTDDEASATSLNGTQTYDDDCDDGEDEADGEQTPGKSYPHSNRKRKRYSSEVADHPATPLSSTSPAEDQAEIMEKHNATLVSTTDLFSPRLSSQDNGDLNLDPRGNSSHIAVLVGKDRSFIQVAQIVAHQAVSGIHTLRASTNYIPEQGSLFVTGLRQQFEEVLACVSSKWGKVSKQCTLKDFVDLDDHDSIKASRDQNPPQPRPPKHLHPTRATPMMGQAVFKFQEPYTCVQRTGTPIDIAASALRFWEELSLAPSHGQKDVTAFCVFPAESVQDQVLTFLNMTKGAYQSCNLGLHNLGDGEQSSGLFPAPVDYGRLEDSSPAFYQACECFGISLGQLNLRGGNTVIYMVNPFPNGQHLPTLCTAFLKLFDTYLATANQKNVGKPNDLVLQIVPSSLIYSADALPMPSPSEYRRLAFEVYDRCGPNDGGPQDRRSHYVSAPSIRLAKAVPKAIDFRLTSDNWALSLQSDSCLHIAYAWTPGDYWLTASWTDNLGVLSWNACYCLGEKNEKPWPIITEIANEVWETTLDMLRPRGGSWHLFVSKSGPILKSELDIWQSKFGNGNNPSVRPSIRSSFFTIDLDPLLEFPIQDLGIRGSVMSMNSLATPDNTPQANPPSPEIFGLGSTPGNATQGSTPPPSTALGDHDGEARLIDVADETWGVVIKTSVEDLYIASDYCPALTCGYLVKRAGPRDEDGLVRIGVSVIHGHTPHRPLLKAVLGWYRNLGLLARVRGIADPVKSVVPCHVAATNKAHAAVSATMRYGSGREDG